MLKPNPQLAQASMVLREAPPAEDLALSFEFFPPNSPAAGERLWTVIRRLETLGPRFVSVTYGAGGSTRERTHAIVTRILAETSLLPAAHLTCVGARPVAVESAL